MYMRKENGKRESPYKGILKFADEKKPQLSFAVVLSVLSSAFGIVPYIAVAILLQKALASSLTTTWAILLPVIALCGYLLKHTLYAKSTLCSHKVAYEIIKNIRTTIMKKMSKVSMGTIQGKSSGEFKQLVIDYLSQRLRTQGDCVGEGHDFPRQVFRRSLLNERHGVHGEHTADHLTAAKSDHKNRISADCTGGNQEDKACGEKRSSGSRQEQRHIPGP